MEKNLLGVVRDHLSPEFLFSASFFAEEAGKIETQSEPIGAEVIFKHRSYIISSITAAVSFLEATINEVYCVACDDLIKTERMPAEIKRRLSTIWKIDSFRDRARLLEKYQTAVELTTGEPFNTGITPYQEVKLVVQLRNALVHYSPETMEIFSEKETGNMQGLEKNFKVDLELIRFRRNFLFYQMATQIKWWNILFSRKVSQLWLCKMGSRQLT
ncbi:hypothetical protein [Methylomonas sp. CM2]|uniref:hypothetical protein n=1 Tax=Methylomonas sp. CM2 TaxID=3417647 RepID=UPI003CEE24F0